jgi:Cys-rich protein (TIGR04453 family)
MHPRLNHHRAEPQPRKSSCSREGPEKHAAMARILVLAMLSLLLTACHDPVEQKCLKICDKVVQCAASDQGAELQTRVRISCMDGCTIHQADILECYNENMECETLGKCMFNAIMSQY